MVSLVSASRPASIKVFPIAHGVVEINHVCNISCLGCYNPNAGISKSYEDVVREIDFLHEKRKLKILTIAGGEPTLHEKLPEVIRYIASLGIRPMLLTNGTLLTEKTLQAYKEAGLTFVMLHIDGSQERRPDHGEVITPEALKRLRRKYADLCGKVGIGAAMQTILYRTDLDALDEVFALVHEQAPSTIGVLVTNYALICDGQTRDAEALEARRPLEVSNERDVIPYMRKHEGADPIFYLPSSHDPEAMRWLFYIAAVTRDDEGRAHKVYVDPRNRLAVAVLGTLFRRQLSFPVGSGFFLYAFLLFAYGMLSFSPTTLFRVFAFLFRAVANGNCNKFVAIFQEAPKRLEDGEFETCLDCPDATVRDGKLMPVCIADKISPIHKGAAETM